LAGKRLATLYRVSGSIQSAVASDRGRDYSGDGSSSSCADTLFSAREWHVDGKIRVWRADSGGHTDVLQALLRSFSQRRKFPYRRELARVLHSDWRLNSAEMIEVDRLTTKHKEPSFKTS